MQEVKEQVGEDSLVPVQMPLNGQPSLNLARYRADLLNRSNEWSNLHDQELRRRAVKAAAEIDIPELLELSEAYLVQEGRSNLLTSPHTIKAYAIGIRQFLEYASTNGISLLRPKKREMQHYVAYLLQAGRTPATVQLKIMTATSLYRALSWAGAVHTNPFTQIIIPKDPTHGLVKRPPYTEDDVSAVLEKAGLQDRVLILLLCHAALRISEALMLTWEDIDVEHRRIQIRQGKGRKDRTVAMSTSMARALKAFRKAAPEAPADARRTTPAQAIFSYSHTTTARYHLKKVFEAAGVKFRGFHPGRKFAGTRLLRQVKDLARVAEHLGHASVETTRKGYVSYDIDDLKDELSHW